MKPYWLLRLIIGGAVKKYTRLVTGTENIPARGPFLIAANHIDFLDALFFTLLIAEKTNQNICFVTKSKNYYVWFPGMSIHIDRKNRSKAVDQVVEKLKKGSIVAIFPEGERYRGKELGRGKTGIARAALRSKMPVLPIGLRCPGHWAFLISLLLLLFRRKRLEVHIGQPMIFTQDYNQEETEERIKRVTNVIMLKIAKLANKEYNY